MRKTVTMFVLGLAALLLPGVSRAQLAAPNEMGVSMGHVHMFVQDVDAAKKFWIAVGGTSFKFGPNEGAKFPGVLILVRKGEPTGGTVGSVINHIGFNVPNVPEALAKWKAAGLKTELGQNPGQCFLYTPDDLTRVEILFTKSDTPTVPTKGRMLDHIGFEITNLEAFCKKAEASGVKLDLPFTKRPDLGISMAYMTDPWGTYIELTEGLNKL
jgi:catechol 2,3-dioxygenase-like lactoylglutathione lyase family enzyme